MKRFSIPFSMMIVVTILLICSGDRCCAETLAEKYKNEGNKWFGQKNYKKAVIAYTNAIMENLDYAEAYYNRGQVFYDQGFFYKAIVDFDMAIRLKPDDSAAIYSRGLAYSKVGKISLALADIKKADKLGDYDAKKLLQSGILTRQQERRIMKDKTIEKLFGENASDYKRKISIIDRNNEFGGNTVVTVHSKGDPLFDGSQGIYKKSELFDSKERKRRDEIIHTGAFNKQNQRNRTHIWYREDGTIEKREFFYTGKMLNIKGVHFYDTAGKIERKAMFDKYGKEMERR